MLAAPAVFLTYRSYRLYVDRLESQKAHSVNIAGLHLRAIEALSLAIEAKDASPDQHMRRVQLYALELGKALRMTEKELEALRAAAVLHDIGTLAIPEHITGKPGRLTPEEFEKVKIHTRVGAEILERVNFPYPVAPLVRSHHERWDGTGYPDGLRGIEIPLGARILAVVDGLPEWKDELFKQEWIDRSALARYLEQAFDKRLVPQRELDRLGDLLKAAFRLLVDFPAHLEVGVRAHGPVLRGKVADVAVGGEHLVVIAKVLVDGLGLGRALDDDELHYVRVWSKRARKVGALPTACQRPKNARFDSPLRGYSFHDHSPGQQFGPSGQRQLHQGGVGRAVPLRGGRGIRSRRD